MLALGIDIGTTTVRANVMEINPQVVGPTLVSETAVQPFCEYTPYLESGELKTTQIIEMLQAWAQNQKLTKIAVGTVLFTGEAQRAANWNEVGQELKKQWPELLSAQLNPDLESRVAALGCGIVERSQNELGKLFIHIDIGGGTANYAKVLNGKITDTSCLNIGCRKWIVDPITGTLLKIQKPAKLLERFTSPLPKIGEVLTQAKGDEIAAHLAKRLVAHALQSTQEFSQDVEFSRETEVLPWQFPNSVNRDIQISLSGGIVACGQTANESLFPFGDLGVFLLRELKQHLETRSIPFHFSPKGSYATAMGISAFGFQISGNSLHHNQNIVWRGTNIQVYAFEEFKNATHFPESFAVKLPTPPNFDLETLKSQAQNIATLLLKGSSAPENKVVFLLEPNLAQSLGYLLRNELGPSQFPNLLILDQIRFPERSTGVELVDFAPDLSKDGQPSHFLVTLKSIKCF